MLPSKAAVVDLYANIFPLFKGVIYFQERLVAIIFGMFRQHKYNFVDVYREEACTGLKAIIKQVNWLDFSHVQVKPKTIYIPQKSDLLYILCAFICLVD